MSRQQKEMAGDYEVIQSLRLGGKVMLIGYNPDDQDGKYMTCYYVDSVGFEPVDRLFQPKQQNRASRTPKKKERGEAR